MTDVDKRKLAEERSARQRRGWITRKENLKKHAAPAPTNAASPFSEQRAAGISMFRYFEAVRLTGDTEILNTPAAQKVVHDYRRVFQIQ